MELEVVTPRGSKAKTSAGMVTAPGTMGELGILPGHRPLLTSLDIGILKFLDGGQTKYLAVNGGYMEVADDKVIVITETAESPEELDLERAKAALGRAEVRLKETDATKKEAYAAAERARDRAENRIAVAKFAKVVVPR